MRLPLLFEPCDSKLVPRPPSASRRSACRSSRHDRPASRSRRQIDGYGAVADDSPASPTGHRTHDHQVPAVITQPCRLGPNCRPELPSERVTTRALSATQGVGERHLEDASAVRQGRVGGRDIGHCCVAPTGWGTGTWRTPQQAASRAIAIDVDANGVVHRTLARSMAMVGSPGGRAGRAGRPDVARNGSGRVLIAASGFGPVECGVVAVSRCR